jgi:2-isopropylmalate synthase
MGIDTIPRDRLDRLTPVAHHVAELVNMALNPQAAYVGSSAFAHKGGIHASAIARRPDAYEHVQPELVGNRTHVVVSELAGRSNLAMKARELGIELDGPQLSEMVDTLKQLEHEGYHFEVADASLELLMRRMSAWQQDWFHVDSWEVIAEQESDHVSTRAIVVGEAGGQPFDETARGNGPVNALDKALRKALNGRYKALDHVHLTDYKVRILDSHKGTGAVTRVLIDSTDGDDTWTTLGVGENIIEASWQALEDSLVYGLLRADLRR